jgi:hypothetical protein
MNDEENGGIDRRYCAFGKSHGCGTRIRRSDHRTEALIAADGAQAAQPGGYPAVLSTLRPNGIEGS